MKIQRFIDYVRSLYRTDEFIPLHAPTFCGNEEAYVLDSIRSTFVSSVGLYVDQLESEVCRVTGSRFAVATSSGTTALHLALICVGVETGQEVITQPLTFVATCNAIAYCGAFPVFIDIDANTLGMSAAALKCFFEQSTQQIDGECVNVHTNRVIKACVPMHTFGHSCEIEQIVTLCRHYGVVVVEDAAEAMGSKSGDKSLGTVGRVGVLSFNGNKIVTAGGGGVLITDCEQLAAHAKHLSTTAKLPHRWEYQHNEIGFNYRMPNLNAALACAQIEQLESFLISKRKLAKAYEEFFQGSPILFQGEPSGTTSNYWLNAIFFSGKRDRDAFLQRTNDAGVMTRPLWELMNRLPMFEQCHTDGLKVAESMRHRLVNIPSSVLPQ